MAEVWVSDWDYDLNQPQMRKVDVPDYSWAASYSAGSDAMIYRRFKGALPMHVLAYAAIPEPRIVAFCEEHNCDVALYDELRGVVRKPRLGTDEAP